jgi:hypothetical protein
MIYAKGGIAHTLSLMDRHPDDANVQEECCAIMSNLAFMEGRERE